MACETGDLAWGLLTPVHWHVGTDQVSLPTRTRCARRGRLARLLDAVRELFTSEGFVSHYGAPTRWYVAHECLADLPCASLDRVIGRNVDRWLPGGARGRACCAGCRTRCRCCCTRTR
jgi:hypothetical protein